MSNSFYKFYKFFLNYADQPVVKEGLQASALAALP
jgi:hypothetical protein